MTTNQTIDGVPRDLLQKIADGAYCHQGLMDRLRALLDAERCTSCDGSGDLIDLTGEWRGYCVCPAGVAVKNKPAAQSQGVPVAWVECSPAWLKAGGDCATAPRLCVGREGISHMHPAHAPQPAPVAVVLAEAREWLGDGKHSDGLTREHWTPEYAALIDRIDATLRK